MEIIKNQNVWRLYDRQATLILTDEKQLRRIAENPELPLFADEERGFSGERHGLYDPQTTLDSFMKDAAERGCCRVEVSYDFFFGGTSRENYPDSELTVRAYKVIHDYALKYGMAFGASLISPLDLGGGYAKTHLNTGFTWQMEEGAIDNGAYRVPMRRQLQWYNNKGPIKLTLVRVMAVAFDAERVPGAGLYAVDENAIVDISDTARYAIKPDSNVLTNAGYGYDLMDVYGKTACGKGRVLIVAEYRTPELDYFADNAEPYIKGVIDLHDRAGIRYQGYYSDEMHIQFDWDLNEHFGPTEIRTRYVTPALIKTYAAKYGAKYGDFLKYMVYFTYTQRDGEWAQYVMGADDEAVYATWLFRKRYFELLSEKIIALSMYAKTYSETLFGGPIMTRAHATWQESPTCDHFSDELRFQGATDKKATRYDYDTPYVFSSTIRENMSACGDYFRWGEFLTGSGTDHPEGGNADRNYYAQAFASSIGALNDFRRAYCACWGSPKEVVRRFEDVGVTYGTGSVDHGVAQDMEHRLSDVLMLYPTELNYVEERFGSWMVQYGYCDYITEEKLLKYGSAEGGVLVVNGRRYRALVALYEIFLDARAMELLTRFAQGGGTLIWSGPPALRSDDNWSLEADFLKLFGLKSVASSTAPVKAGGRSIVFEGALKALAPMEILTNYLPDFVYPAESGGADAIARLDGQVVGASRAYGAGRCVYLGFRPRDDQSQSLGADVSTLFDLLAAFGAYSEHSLEAVSRPRNARYILNRFPNGAVSIANHYRTFEERWYGSFFRDADRDAELLRGRELPPIEIELDGDAIDGRAIRYLGTDALTFRVYSDSGKLAAFVGHGTDGIAIDDIRYTLFDKKADIAFARMDARHLADGIGELILAKADRPGVLTLPVPEGFASAVCEACELDYLKTSFAVPCAIADGQATIVVDDRASGKWIALYTLK